MKRLLVFVATVVFVDTVFYSAIAPLLPRYSAVLDLSKSEAGILAGSYAAGTLVAALPAGWLAARAGVRPTVLCGLGLMSACSFAFAFGETAAVLSAARFLQGVGGAASWAGALAWLVGAAPSGRRAQLIGTALAAAIVGSLFGPVLGAAADAFGPQAAFSTVAVLSTVMMLWALRMPTVAPEGARTDRLLAALRDSGTYLSMWLVALPGLLLGTIGVLGPLRLAELGAGTVMIAAVFLLAAGLEAVVSPVSGHVADRRGRLVPAVVGVTAAIVPVVLMPWPESAWGLAGLMLLTAPAVGVLWAPALALLSDTAERHGMAQGMAIAMTNLAWAAGHTVGAVGSARLAQRAGDVIPFALLAMLCAGSALLLTGMLRRRSPAPVQQLG